jgi:hypothetical protein
MALKSLKYSFRMRISPSHYRKTGGRNLGTEFADYRRGSIAFSATQSTIVPECALLDGH